MHGGRRRSHDDDSYDGGGGGGGGGVFDIADSRASFHRRTHDLLQEMKTRGLGAPGVEEFEEHLDALYAEYQDSVGGQSGSRGGSRGGGGPSAASSPRPPLPRHRSGGGGGGGGGGRLSASPSQSPPPLPSRQSTLRGSVERRSRHSSARTSPEELRAIIGATMGGSGRSGSGGGGGSTRRAAAAVASPPPAASNMQTARGRTKAAQALQQQKQMARRGGGGTARGRSGGGGGGGPTAAAAAAAARQRRRQQRRSSADAAEEEAAAAQGLRRRSASAPKRTRSGPRARSDEAAGGASWVQSLRGGGPPPPRSSSGAKRSSSHSQRSVSAGAHRGRSAAAERSPSQRSEDQRWEEEEYQYEQHQRRQQQQQQRRAVPQPAAAPLEAWDSASQQAASYGAGQFYPPCHVPPSARRVFSASPTPSPLRDAGLRDAGLSEPISPQKCSVMEAVPAKASLPAVPWPPNTAAAAASGAARAPPGHVGYPQAPGARSPSSTPLLTAASAAQQHQGMSGASPPPPLHSGGTDGLGSARGAPSPVLPSTVLGSQQLPAYTAAPRSSSEPRFTQRRDVFPHLYSSSSADRRSGGLPDAERSTLQAVPATFRSALASIHPNTPSMGLRSAKTEQGACNPYSDAAPVSSASTIHPADNLDATAGQACATAHKLREADIERNVQAMMERIRALQSYLPKRADGDGNRCAGFAVYTGDNDKLKRSASPFSSVHSTHAPSKPVPVSSNFKHDFGLY